MVWIFTPSVLFCIENDIDGESAVMYSQAALKDFRQAFPGHVGPSYVKLHLAMKQHQQV